MMLGPSSVLCYSGCGYHLKQELKVCVVPSPLPVLQFLVTVAMHRTKLVDTIVQGVWNVQLIEFQPKYHFYQYTRGN